MNELKIVYILIAALLISSCTSITVKDAAPNDNFGDNLADGYLYYPRRPYLHVKKEFVIEGNEGYVKAIKTVDGFRFRSPWDNEDISVPIGGIYSANKSAEFTSGDDSASGDSVVKNSDSTSENRKTLSKATATAGYNPAVKEVEPLGEFFDIVYLPDVDNPRVLSYSSHFGIADVNLAYGPGNTLNTFQTTEDNSEIGFIAKDLVDSTLKAAKSIAEMNYPGLALLTSGQVDDLKKQNVGETMMFKYIYLVFATPNLSPLVKEREFATVREIKSGNKDPNLLRPEFPYTRFAFKTRKEYRLVKVDFEEGPISKPSKSNDLENTFTKEKELQDAINRIFSTKKTLNVNNNGKSITLMFNEKKIPDPSTPDFKAQIIWYYNPSVVTDAEIGTLLPEVFKETLNFLKNENFTPPNEAQNIISWLETNQEKPGSIISLQPSQTKEER